MTHGPLAPWSAQCCPGPRAGGLVLLDLEGRSRGGLNDPKHFANLRKASARHQPSWPRVLEESGSGEVKGHSWRGTGPHAAASGVGKACGVVTGGGETYFVVLLVLLATVEVVGLGADVNHGWLQGGSSRMSPQEGSWGVLPLVGGGLRH